LRPVIGRLRFDDDDILIAAGVGKAVFEKAVSGKTPDQEIDFPFDGAALAENEARGRPVRRPRASFIAFALSVPNSTA